MTQSIFDTLRMRRHYLRLSQSEVAKLAGLHRNTVSAIEKEYDLGNINLNTLERLCVALGMRLDIEANQESEKKYEI